MTQQRKDHPFADHYTDFMGFLTEISCIKWNSSVMQFRDER